MNGPIGPMGRPARPDLLWRLARALSCITVTSMLGAGCAHPGGDRSNEAGESGRQAREFEMNRRWHERPMSHLVAALGEPKLRMNIPGGGNPPGFVIVYGLDPASGCIDAFALVYGTDPLIRAYYCR